MNQKVLEICYLSTKTSIDVVLLQIAFISTTKTKV